MQQISPEEQLTDQQIINIIQLENQMAQSTANMQAFRSNQIIVLKNLRNEAVFKLIFSFIELLLLFLAFGFLPEPCVDTSLREFFILAIIVNAMQAFQMLYLLLIIWDDLGEIDSSETENRLPYPEYSFANTKYLSDAISDYHNCYKFIKYLTILLDVVVFLFTQVELYKNLYGACKIGDSEFDFTWGVAFTYLILRYITLGIPILIFVIYVVVLPFAYCINIQSLQKINRVGASQENLNKLKVETVGLDKISDDNECVICLSEFIEGEEFVRLDCHPYHVYHKGCISDWLKARLECPKCRQPVKFD
ncbi:unnamed protein product (macronuclear) [Paramecium tetraurelia]|uniref:RING-type domain-containing protein n=1 Tax=Paramecium tetraurelia TaxID=5888 RepID=A0DWH0_PARTE|nr:uncharacterized protein GSPATT00021029001 [Paramecium tetraurelia]CAK87387.1 unnamed protein product [Paramecium tetraurelia]|eukprot:XP_001454784.1 hypothetical protein (macronuclear) [Paramecium tetraurelia strain d4-2]